MNSSQVELKQPNAKLSQFAVLNRKFIDQYVDFGSDGHELVQGLIGRFLERSDAKAEQLAGELFQQDWDKIYFESHALKNSCTNLGLDRLAEFCRQLENVAEAHKPYDAEEMSSKLRDLYLESRAAVLEMQREFAQRT